MVLPRRAGRDKSYFVILSWILLSKSHWPLIGTVIHSRRYYPWAVLKSEAGGQHYRYTVYVTVSIKSNHSSSLWPGAPSRCLKWQSGFRSKSMSTMSIWPKRIKSLVWQTQATVRHAVAQQLSRPPFPHNFLIRVFITLRRTQYNAYEALAELAVSVISSI